MANFASLHTKQHSERKKKPLMFRLAKRAKRRSTFKERRKRTGHQRVTFGLGQAKMEFKSCEPDVRLFQAYYKAASWIGMVPHRSKSGSIKWILLIFRMTLATCIITLGLYTRANGRYLHYTKIFKLVNCSQTLTRYILVISSLVISMRRSPQWNAVFEEIRHFSIWMDSFGYKSSNNEHPSLHSMKFIPCYIAIVLLNVWEIYIHEESILVAITLKPLMLYPLFLVILVNLILRIIKNRYKRLSDLLVTKTQGGIQDEKSIAEVIRKIKTMYANCDNLIQNFNEIFGLLIFMSSITTSFTILSCLVWAYETSIGKDNQQPGSFSQEVCLLFVAAIYVMLSTSYDIKNAYKSSSNANKLKTFLRFNKRTWSASKCRENDNQCDSRLTQYLISFFAAENYTAKWALPVKQFSQ
nr:unnamed protein product [Callosobruchus analis]